MQRPDTKVPWLDLVGDYDRIRNAIEAVFPEFKDYNKRIGGPGGFSLPLPATERVWDTPSGKAEFLLYQELNEDPGVVGDGVFRLNHHPQPRSVKHHDLRQGRPLPRCIRPARCHFHERRGHRRAPA